MTAPAGDYQARLRTLVAQWPCCWNRSREASISFDASSREYQPSTVTFFCSRSL